MVVKIDLPKSVSLTWGGQFQNFNRAKERLALLVPVSLGFIALMLLVMFRRFRWVLITVLGLPFGVAGGVLALWMRGLPFSIPAGVGFIALSGISVCTGIVLTTNLLTERSSLADGPATTNSASWAECGAAPS